MSFARVMGNDQGHDKKLGLGESITRRDFLQAALVGSGDALMGGGDRTAFLRGPDWDGPGGVGDYRHANGNSKAVMDAGHGIRARLYETLSTDTHDTGETYDLVVVGGGLSGLAAATLFQQTAAPKRQQQTTLVLDNHSLFGGEARQNEFQVGGHRLIAHQGSAVFWIPRRDSFLERFYASIGLDRPALDYQTWKGPPPAIPGVTPYNGIDGGPTTGFFFGAKFGQPPGRWLIDPWKRQLEGAPITAFARADLLRLKSPDVQAAIDRARPKTEGDAQSRRLDRITLEDHLMATAGIRRDTVRSFLTPVEGSGYGLGPDALSAYCAYAAEVQLPAEGEDQMFPGGNTGFARLMVKTLIPTAIPGPRTPEGVHRYNVDRAALDRTGQANRVRLDATVVAVEHEGAAETASRVRIAYVQNGRVSVVHARAVIMAGGSWTTKQIVRDLPDPLRQAYAGFFRSPCLIANVAVRNWRFLHKLGITSARWFEGIGNYLAVRRMATLGGVARTISPDDPTVLTFKILYSYPGERIDVQGMRGRLEMLQTSFRDYERKLRTQLADMFTASGFDPRRDIAGVILNRWGHAYVNPQPGFFFGPDGKGAGRDRLRAAPFGRIAFANTDLAGVMDHRNAILEANRAVEQVRPLAEG